MVSEAADALAVEQLQPLRSGGQKTVLAGSHRGETVVLKVIAVMAPHETMVLERARREVALLAQVADRRVVALRSGIAALGDPQRPHGVAWLEEHLDGSDLRDLLTASWSPPQIADLLVGLARGLELLHQRDVVHRDLSPGNVRCRADGLWTLMDPGLAKHLAEQSITGIYQPGTPGFRSPEHVPGGTPAPHSDVFCAGVLTYLAATGQLPVDPSGSDDQYYERLRTLPVPSVFASRPDLPGPLAVVIDKCLHRQPARRYLDASELLKALSSAGAIT